MTTSEPKRQALPNEAPPGAKARYKHTKLGWIPEEWDLQHLGNVIDIRNGQVDPKDPEYSAMTLVAPNHIEIGTGRLIEKVSALKQDAISGKYFVERGQVIYSKIRPYLKKAVLADEDCLCSADAYPISGKETLDNRFLLLTMLSERFTYYAISASGRTGIPKVNRDDLSDFMVALPPLPEQRRIAQVLGAWDRAIATVQQLLAAQQERKRGLMQELLTGRKRFKGFEPKGGGQYKKSKIGPVPSDWKVVHAGDAFRNVSERGTAGALLAVTQDQGIVRREDMDRRVVMPEGSTDGYKAVAPGDFVISLRTFQGGIEWSSVAGLVSPAYTVLRLKDENFLPEFVALYFKSYVFIQRLSNAVVGIRDGKNISFPDFKIQHLPQPPLEEQKHIAAAINAADSLEKEYRTQLDHLTTQKRGLMQQLLTGAVRVKH